MCRSKRAGRESVINAGATRLIPHPDPVPAPDQTRLPRPIHAPDPTPVPDPVPVQDPTKLQRFIGGKSVASNVTNWAITPMIVARLQRKSNQKSRV